MNLRYLFTILFSVSLLSCKVQYQKLNEFDSYFYTEEIIETYYNVESEDWKNEKKNDVIYLKVFTYFDDSSSLFIDDEELFSGKTQFEKAEDHQPFLLLAFKQKKDNQNILKYYSHKYHTKVEFAVDTRYPCLVISYGLDSNLPPADWDGYYPITCFVSYMMSCFGP